MKRMTMALLLAASGCVYSRVDERPTMTVEDVVRMSEAGVDQGTLLARIQTSRLAEPVTADDIIRMKNQKVPDPVIRALAESAPVPVTVVERPVYVEPSFGFRYGYYPHRNHWHRHPYRPYYSRPRYYHAPR